MKGQINYIKYHRMWNNLKWIFDGIRKDRFTREFAIGLMFLLEENPHIDIRTYILKLNRFDLKRGGDA